MLYLLVHFVNCSARHLHRSTVNHRALCHRDNFSRLQHRTTIWIFICIWVNRKRIAANHLQKRLLLLVLSSMVKVWGMNVNMNIEHTEMILNVYKTEIVNGMLTI